MDPPEDSNIARFSLVRGGPLHALLRAARLARDDRGNPWRQSLASVALTWAPLVGLGLVERLTTGRWDPLALDPAVHARLLVTVPLLLGAEELMHTFSERCVARFVQSGLVADGPLAIQRVVSRGARLRDARLPEAVLAVLALAAGQASLWKLPVAHFTLSGTAIASSPVSIWWGLVSLPVAQFLLYRSLWRWAIWSFVLRGLARLDVRPVAAHPDKRGGLAFVAEPVLAFALVVMAVDCFVAGSWGGQILFRHLALQSFALPLSEIAFASVVVTLGPLCVFSGCMWRARFAALRQYDLLALDYARGFQEKWIDGRRSENLLGTADIQSAADLANVLAIVRGMRLVPFGLQEIVALVGALSIPMVPLLLAVVPLDELVRRAAGVFLAALPGGPH